MTRDTAETRLLARLLDASRAADEVEAQLAAARDAYRHAPSDAGLEALRAKSIEALQLELQFQAIWRDAAAELVKPSR